MEPDLAYLVEIGRGLIASAPSDFSRSALRELQPDDRLQVVLGPRGVGKTTLLLQFGRARESPVAYLSLDDLYFAANSLVDAVRQLREAGTYSILLDEVHLYPGWSRELKNVYDRYPDVRLVVTGSSALDLFGGQADLSRRAAVVTLGGLSFREWLSLSRGFTYDAIPWDTLRTDHADLARAVLAEVRTPLALFEAYLTEGAYPFAESNRARFLDRIRRTIDLVLERDIPAVADLRPQTVRRMKRFLALIAEEAPFKPNVHKLAGTLETSRDTVYVLLDLLERAQVIKTLPPGGRSDAKLARPDKIYLGNATLAHALHPAPNVGTLRETFFAASWPVGTALTLPSDGDFAMGEDTFEVGGRGKSFSQVADQPRSYLAVDGLEVGHDSRIPLFLFGFLR